MKASRSHPGAAARMRLRPPADRLAVRLTGIVLRHQGTHDSLCAYYAAAMMLCALRPEFDDEFDTAEVAADPIFRNLPRRGGLSLDRMVTRSLTTGIRFDDIALALNRACKGSGSSFTHIDSPRGDAARIRALVDAGLPCVIGWESREAGNHTVVAVGYERYRNSTREWIRVIDPARSQDALEWRQLNRLARVDLIVCERHDGVRPDKLTTQRAAQGTLLKRRTLIERWEPRTGQYVAIHPAAHETTT